MMEVSGAGGCYCCSRPTASSMAEMDLDCALNELGMLSTVTESRKQYLREKRSRAKSESEKESTQNPEEGCSELSGTMDALHVENIPRGYQVLKMNSKYIVGMSTPSPLKSLSLRGRSNSEPSEKDFFSLGEKYSKNVLNSERKSSRVARIKLARVRRFQQPYNVPWWLSKSAQTREGPSTSAVGANDNAPSDLSELSASGFQLPVSFHRSKSLNDLDISKVQVSSEMPGTSSGQATSSTAAAKKEIDNVSDHLQGLHVNDAEFDRSMKL